MEMQFVKQKIADFCQLSEEALDETLPIQNLVSDSFMLVEMMLMLQEELDIKISHEDLEGVSTLGNLFDVLRKIREG